MRISGLSRLALAAGCGLALAACGGDVNVCADVTCSGHGSCIAAGGVASCFCLDGYDEVGLECVESNACLAGTHACDPNAACWDTDTGYTCTCLNGYVGNGFSCANVDECAAGTDDCSPDADCDDTIGSFTCTCRGGFAGDGRVCDDEDECLLGTHSCDANAACANTTGGYTCTCNAGFAGDGFSCLPAKVLILAVDGLRPDALANADAPTLDGLRDAGLYSDVAQAGDITLGGPGWATVLTGVWRPKHGVTDDTFSGGDFIAHPDLFTRLNTARPGLDTVWINSWPAMDAIGVPADTAISHDFAADGSDTASVDDAVAQLAADPDLLFVYFGMVDAAGRAHGFHPAVAEYTAAIETMDAQVAQILAAVEGRATFAEESWLVVLTSAHGGGSATDTTTGANAPADRRVPFLLWSPGVIAHGAGGEIFPPPTLADVAPTVIDFLGVLVLPTWQLDGEVVRAESTRPAAALGVNLVFNPGAEADRGFDRLDVDGTASGWLESGGGSAVVYGSAGLPDDSQLAPTPTAPVGMNLFAGGVPMTTSLTQVIDLAPLQLAEGTTYTVTVSAYLGGRAAEADAATVNVRLRDDRRGAAVGWRDFGGVGQHKLFIFYDDWVWRYDASTRTRDLGFPVLIASAADPPWDCVWPSNIDAAVLASDGAEIHFFKGAEHIRYDTATHLCVAGYPRPIADDWPGLDRFRGGARDLDAAMLWQTAPARYYFFKGDELIRYEPGPTLVDLVPRLLSGVDWPGLQMWPAGIDMAASDVPGFDLFFKQGWYIEYNEVAGAAEPGFPQPVDAGSWPDLDALSLAAAGLSLGPVTAADRASATQLLYRQASEPLPWTTREVEVEVLFTADTGAGDACADQISVVVTSP